MDPGADPAVLSDVRLCGYLRKQKSHHRRFFVLRGASERGPARLEYYENEKKFRAGGPGGSRPKRAFPLASALNINKRTDARYRHLIILYGRDGTFGVAAENAEQQQAWYAAMVELHCKGKAPVAGDPEAAVVPGPAFKEVWQVSLRPRGLGHTKNLAGMYLLCLTEKTINFVKLNSDVAAVVLQLLNVRRCGHSENYFFMEVGRSAVTGPGELWMQVEDLVVAQNMHETILEAMKALSEEFRVRSKSQSLASTPISVPPRRQHLGNPPAGQGAFPWRPRGPEGTPSLSHSPAAPGPKAGSGPRKADSLSDYSALSSDEGGSSPGEWRPPSCTPDPLSYMLTEAGELDYIAMGKVASQDRHRLAKWASGAEAHKRASLPPLALDKGTPGLPRRRKPALVALAISASYPEGLNLRGADPGYMAMLPGVATGAEDRDYVPMTPGSVSPPRESGGYVLMSPSGSCSPDGPGPWGESKSLGSDYMNMSPASRSASSTPPEYCPLLAIAGGAPFYSLPRSYKHLPQPLRCPFNPGRLSCSSSTSSESLEEAVGAPGCPLGLFVGLPGAGGDVPPATPRSPGEYVSIEYHSAATDYVNMELRAAPAECSGAAVPDTCAEMAPAARLVRAHPQEWCRCHCSETFLEAERNGGLPSEAQMETGLNYIDLDLVKEAAPEMAGPALRPSAGPGQAGALHTYASIDFHRSGELLRGHKGNSEGADS
ncbi:LOW QUALITY PROTEIN: insulin receptor substrate 1-like [Elgaria multicarinata webbii]|uniref:LOW QUALITY PROTEIN: insulin receptor substrate 1-like n=1 Tax=Elgaria multicarinata webbii TaxID=159646 RepID=UPI002FCCDCFA